MDLPEEKNPTIHSESEMKKAVSDNSRVKPIEDYMSGHHFKSTFTTINLNLMMMTDTSAFLKCLINLDQELGTQGNRIYYLIYAA